MGRRDLDIHLVSAIFPRGTRGLNSLRTLPGQMRVFGKIYLSPHPPLGQCTGASQDAAAGVAAGALAVTWREYNDMRFTLRSRAPPDERLIIELHKLRDDGNAAADGTSMIDILSIEMNDFQHRDRNARARPPVTVTRQLAYGSQLQFTYRLGAYVSSLAVVGRQFGSSVRNVAAAFGIVTGVVTLGHYADHDGDGGDGGDGGGD